MQPVHTNLSVRVNSVTVTELAVITVSENKSSHSQSDEQRVVCFEHNKNKYRAVAEHRARSVLVCQCILYKWCSASVARCLSTERDADNLISVAQCEGYDRLRFVYTHHVTGALGLARRPRGIVVRLRHDPVIGQRVAGGGGSDQSGEGRTLTFCRLCRSGAGVTRRGTDMTQHHHYLNGDGESRTHTPRLCLIYYYIHIYNHIVQECFLTSYIYRYVVDSNSIENTMHCVQYSIEDPGCLSSNTQT